MQTIFHIYTFLVISHSRDASNILGICCTYGSLWHLSIDRLFYKLKGIIYFWIVSIPEKSIYIYKTEASAAPTIFHVSIFFLIFKSDLFLLIKYIIYIPSFLNPNSLPDIILKPNTKRQNLEQQHKTAKPRATVQGQNGRTSPFDKTKPRTSPLNITHQTQNIFTLSNTHRSKLFCRKLARAWPWEPTFSIFDPTSISAHSISVSLN